MIFHECEQNKNTRRLNKNTHRLYVNAPWRGVWVSWKEPWVRSEQAQGDKVHPALQLQRGQQTVGMETLHGRDWTGTCQGEERQRSHIKRNWAFLHRQHTTFWRLSSGPKLHEKMLLLLFALSYHSSPAGKRPSQLEKHNAAFCSRGSRKKEKKRKKGQGCLLGAHSGGAFSTIVALSGLLWLPWHRKGLNPLTNKIVSIWGCSHTQSGPLSRERVFLK